jgi:MFS family permease
MSKINNNVTLYSLVAAFGGFVFGLDLMNISGAIGFISSLFELDNGQKGRVVGIGFLGVVCALFFVGTLVERFGRKKILIAIALAYSLSSLMSAFAVSYEMLVIGRFIGGAAFASITVSAMYIGEIAPAKQRGKFVSVNQLMIAIGILLASVINFFLIKYLDDISWLNNENVWRYMLGAELIANAIWVALLLSVPESPRWLLKKGRVEEAKEIINKIVPADEVEAFISDVNESFHHETKTDTFTQLKNLFHKRMTLVLWIAIAYAIVQGGTGMNALLSFAPMVFEQVGMTTEDTFMQTIVMGIVNLSAVFIAIFTVEKLGRRFLTLTGLVLVIVAHSASWFGFKDATYVFNDVAFVKIQEQLKDQKIDITKLQSLVGTRYQNDVELKKTLKEVLTKKELPIASGAIINNTIVGVNSMLILFGIFAMLAAFNMSIGPILWVIFSEIFPNNVRSVALPFAALVQTLSSWAISELFPWQLDTFGAANIFLMYGFIGAMGFIVMYFILPETKGKSIELIEKELVKY